MNNTLTYKGYTGTVEVSEEDDCLFGKVLFIKSLLTYEGQSLDEIKADFRDAIDDYLELCKEKGWEPEKPFRGSFNVRLSPEVHRKLAIAAARRGETLNKYVSEVLEAAVSEV